MDQENHYHILVVDDDEVDRRAVSWGLANSGLQVEVEEARDGSQAIDILKPDRLRLRVPRLSPGPGQRRPGGTQTTPGKG